MTTDLQQLRQKVGERFHRPAAPTYVGLQASQRIPVLVSFVASDVRMPDKTLAPRQEEAFAIHVHHRPVADAETWIGARHAKLPYVGTGGICMFDLRTEPVALIHDEGFEFTRFFLARATLDDLAYKHDMPRIGHFRLPPFGHHDPVLEHIALALRARVQVGGNNVDSLFSDWMALAFHAHVASTYGESPVTAARYGALTPGQLRTVCDWMTERLAQPLSIADIAGQVGLAPGHFARAFRAQTGEPPHRWLVAKRVERAKELLGGDLLTIAEVAMACGFTDQSHLTRVFTRREKTTPGSWRRRHRA